MGPMFSMYIFSMELHIFKDVIHHEVSISLLASITTTLIKCTSVLPTQHSQAATLLPLTRVLCLPLGTDTSILPTAAG